MKQRRIIQIAIFVVNLVLATFCLVAYSREDKVKPEFLFQTSDYIYTPSAQTDALLRDIMARDDRDGDITERIVIEKVTENREGSTIVVYYAVSDSAGNVAKISRVFPAVFDEPEQGGAVETYAGAQVSTVEMLQSKAAEGETDESDGKEADGENTEDADEHGQETKDIAVNDGRTNGESESTGQAEENEPEDNRRKEEEEAQNNRRETEEETETDGGEVLDGEDDDRAQEQESRQQEPTDVERSGAPILTLREQEVTIEAGTSPPWTEIIETLWDDKDDYETLYYNLSVGRFNRNQPGDYPVTLYTEDSDGNRSGTVAVMVHVKGAGN